MQIFENTIKNRVRTQLVYGLGLVGMTRLEHAASASRTQRSTKLSYIPKWIS